MNDACLPVFLVRTVDGEEEWWEFVAASDRKAALAEGAIPLDTYARDQKPRYYVRAVDWQGGFGVSRKQATVYADKPRNLNGAELAALGWKLCPECEGYVRIEGHKCEAMEDA